MLQNKKQLHIGRKRVPYYKQKNKNQKSRYKESAIIKMIRRRHALNVLNFQKQRTKKKSIWRLHPILRGVVLDYSRPQNKVHVPVQLQKKKVRQQKRQLIGRQIYEKNILDYVRITTPVIEMMI